MCWAWVMFSKTGAWSSLPVWLQMWGHPAARQDHLRADDHACQKTVQFFNKHGLVVFIRQVEQKSLIELQFVFLAASLPVHPGSVID